MKVGDSAWVKFTADFDYRFKPNALTAYKKGMVRRVNTECKDKAIAAGKAVPWHNPRTA